MSAAEREIVAAVESVVGRRPVLLAGSRAVGGSEPGSDWDVAVVLPVWRIPMAAGRLAQAAAGLEARLACGVSINPLSERPLRKGRRLFAWKLRREARVLAAPAGFALAEPGEPTLTPFGEFSYLLSAVFYLLEDLEPEPSPPSCAGPRVAAGRGAEKAERHLRQLELLREGCYEPSPEIGTAAPDWFATRGRVLGDLARLPPQPGRLRGVLRNVQYAGISAARGSNRLRTALSPTPVERRLAAAATALLGAPRPDGSFDRKRAEDARYALPRSLRPPGSDWRSLRDVISREWANAHPLLGL